MITLRRLAAVIAIGVGLAACSLGGSPQTRYYSLSPMVEASGTEQKTRIEGTVGVGPIVLPVYLDRQEIVVPTTRYRRDLAVFDQWVEPLKANMTRTLSENIAVQLPKQTILSFPWSSSLRVDTQILVDVIQFDGVPGQTATLVAQWTVVSGKSRDVLSTNRVDVTVPVDGSSYEALAASLSSALETLSRDIVAGLRTAKPAP